MLQLLKPLHLEPVLCNKRNHSNEKPVHHNSSGAVTDLSVNDKCTPLVTTRESPHAVMKTQCNQSINTEIKNRREGHNYKQENFKMERLTGKGKHRIKVGNHPHTKLVGRLKDKSSKIICIHNKQLRDAQKIIRCKI